MYPYSMTRVCPCYFKRIRSYSSTDVWMYGLSCLVTYGTNYVGSQVKIFLKLYDFFCIALGSSKNISLFTFWASNLNLGIRILFFIKREYPVTFCKKEISFYFMSGTFAGRPTMPLILWIYGFSYK